MLHAELLNRWRDIFEVHNSLLEDRLKEDNHDSDLTIFLQACRSNSAALLHAILDEEKSKFFREVYMVLNSIENFKE